MNTPAQENPNKFFLRNQWLKEHGDRNESEDLQVDEDGPYVLMRNGEGSDVRVHLPSFE